MFLFITHTKNPKQQQRQQYSTHLWEFLEEKKFKNQNLVTKTLHTLQCSGFYQVFFCYLCFVLYTVKYLWYLPTYHQLQYMLPDCCVWDNIIKKNNLCIVAATTKKKNIEENTVYKTLRIGNSSYNNSKEKKIPRKQHGFGLEC